MENVDVIVIGSGLSGLTAANILAKEGKNVVVIEKSNRLGGRSITNSSQGFLFNIGAHALYTSGEAFEVLEELNLTINGGDANTPAHGIWENKVYPIPTGFGSLLATPLLSFKEKIQFAKLMMKLMNMKMDQIPVMSLEEWVEKEIKEPLIKKLFYALSRTTTYTIAPSLQMARPVIRQLQRAMKKNSVLYVDGGWESIVSELRRNASSLKVKFYCQSKAVKMEQHGHLHKVYCANNDWFTAEHVILAIPPSDAFHLIQDAESTSLYQWKKQSIPVTATCLDLGLKKLPVQEHQFVLGLDQPVFFTNESRAGNVTTSTGVVVHLIKYHNPEEQQYDPKVNKNELEKTMDLVQPGWRKELIAEQFLPKITVVHDFPHINRKIIPEPEIPEIKGVYVAGDWAGNEEVLSDAAIASGKRAATHILAKNKLLI
ncbi:FAD-dependent oxidoreductase [Bacillus sp. FJAT-49736]|uniref:protoporphyrinogen/coproporphyrinogen oxidase n=1 Tax=Bacillus sp. FJAT-49736 TaxID=2833582 RepID=UPI001BC9144B|nr:FAD-dependent oxidoreductase [Bacillus sp. FJAT-49736]MBS4174734.1 FAD-dependent oxidoreductase [Bacillus sp. FJAT-49736]